MKNDTHYYIINFLFVICHNIVIILLFLNISVHVFSMRKDVFDNLVAFQVRKIPEMN